MKEAWELRGAFRWACGGVALGLAALAVIIGIFSPASFFHAYLFAALACLNPTLGCLLLVFIHRMTGGAWGETLAPALSAGQRMLPWTMFLCLPLFFGLGRIFPWAHPDALSEPARAFLANHPAYFSQPWFILRTVSYSILFLVLLGMARYGRRAAWTGPLGMILYILAVYLLSVDWVLSLEPGWHSTGFPVIFMASQSLSALAFCIAATIFSGSPEQESKIYVWKDIGNLLLGTLMFWAYVAYAQFLIVWSGNLPHQAVWYLHRNAGGWHYFLIALVVFQLLLPGLLLLSSRTKRRTRCFAGLAVGVLLCQVLYVYWLVIPSFRPRGIDFHWLDLLLPLAFGGFWLFRFVALIPAASREEAHV